MTDATGGIHSAEDADSEGVEGKFYVWTPDEIREELDSDDAEKFCRIYDVTPSGNFEGKSILNLPQPIEDVCKANDWDLVETEATLANARRHLLAVRDRRIRPGKDDKVLVSWNALAIGPLARAGNIFREPRFLHAATQAANFIVTQMRDSTGKLLHNYCRGQAKLAAYLDDYANFCNALVTLYEQTFDESWIDHAVEFAESMLARFGDKEAGGFFYTADDHEKLISPQQGSSR